jgi:hypothetical protein
MTGAAKVTPVGMQMERTLTRNLLLALFEHSAVATHAEAEERQTGE